MDEKRWMGIAERTVNQMLLQAIRDLCSLRNAARLLYGSKYEHGFGRAPHIYYSQHDRTTLTNHNSMQITCRLYCAMSGCRRSCLSVIANIGDQIANQVWAFHYNHVVNVMTTQQPTSIFHSKKTFRNVSTVNITYVA